MLGEAPGTARLGEWVEAVDGGMSLEDLANHIAASDAFQATYPNFSTNDEFASAFLGNVLGGNVSATLMSAAVGIVTGLLNDGMTRGALALAVVGALHDISAAGADHPAYGDLGAAAMAFANKVEVASHYTLEARMADPSSDALEGVTADADSVAMAIEAIGAGSGDDAAGQNFVLTPTIDNIEGGDADDTIVAQPIAQVSNVFQDVLNPFDTIDGGGGTDTIYIYGVEPSATLNLGAEDVSNVENVSINTVGGINADFTDWDGVAMVDLRRFGDESDVTVIVDDGATVSSSRTFGGNATIVGAAGELDIMASGASDVVIGSAGQTGSVMVKGGASVTIGKNADGGGQSMTVTSVHADGVKLSAGTETTEASGTFVPLTDTNGFLTNQNGSDLITITTGSADGTGGTTVNQVGLDEDDGVTLTNAFGGAAITVSYSWDHDGDKAAADVTAAPDADPPVAAATGPLVVTAELKFDVNTGGLAFGKITAITPNAGSGTAFTPNAAGTEFTGTINGADATIKADALDGESGVPVTSAFTSAPIGREDAAPDTVLVGAMPTLTINSDAIEDLTLTSTEAIVLVHNDSKTTGGRNMPEDLAVTVDGYGSFQPWGAPKTAGKLCVAGAGSAENIMLTVAGASYVDLNSNTVKMLDISADARLALKVSKFNADGMPAGTSETLASVTVSGEGAVSMDTLGGMRKLASIDASASSGNNSFKSDAELAALETAMGGSGNDTFALGTSLRGKLESVTTGDGNDTVMMSGDYRDDGLTVDLGAGDDTFHGGEGNAMSRIDGGDGRDTLRLSKDGATYGTGANKASIYSNFEILDVGGGMETYDVAMLGVDTIVANKSTDAGGVTLDNVGAGTSLSVSAERAGVGTTAVVAYNFADDVNVAGSIIDGGTTNVLDVSLMARGGSGDLRTGRSGETTLMIELDQDLLAMTIDSNASVHGAAAGRGVTSGHYQNTVTVDGDPSALEEVKITGNAMTHLSGDGLARLQYVNATESGAGVMVDASMNTGPAATRVRLAGSDHDDTLTAGDFDGTAVTARNVLMGNGGDDMLTGGEGRDLLNGGAGADTLDGGDTDAGATDAEDRFVYNAASDSQVTFSRNADDPSVYDAKGYDTIMGFGGTFAADATNTRDKLHFSKALHAIVTAGNVRHVNEWAAATGEGATNTKAWTATSIDGNAVDANANDFGAANLFDFIGDGKGLFITTVVGEAGGDFGASTSQVKNSMAVIGDTTVAAEPGLWLLVDIDADGNFDAATDMVIFLAGVPSATDTSSFDASTDITS